VTHDADPLAFDHAQPRRPLIGPSPGNAGDNPQPRRARTTRHTVRYGCAAKDPGGSVLVSSARTWSIARRPVRAHTAGRSTLVVLRRLGPPLADPAHQHIRRTPHDCESGACDSRGRCAADLVSRQCTFFCAAALTSPWLFRGRWCCGRLKAESLPAAQWRACFHADLARLIYDFRFPALYSL